MAEFALGLTKTAVEGTLSRVLSAIETEAKLKARVQQDLVFITGEFQMMQAFLNVANAERANNEVVRTWVRQLRDLAFDVEDCVEFVVHLDDKSSWWWRAVPSCISDLVLPPLPLDEAAAEIKLLKARVDEVSQRNTRYNLITDSGDKPVSPAEQPATASASVPAFHILREVWETAGKQRRGLGVDDLHKLITSDDSDLQVISVWSSAGGDLGATSILNKEYGDREICQEFKSRAWVKLMHPFNRDEFLENLQNKERYLVILEEVSTVVEWDAIREYLPDSKNGSRIIVSTRQLEIARLCTGEPYQVSELRRSSDGQSLCAFFKKGCVDHEYRPSITTNKKNRREEAHDWRDKNKLSGRQGEMKSLQDRLRRKMTSVSVWGIAGVGKSALVKSIYYNRMLKPVKTDDDFVMFSWVEVRDQFNLTDLSRRLLLDFHSDDLQAKETAAIGIMEGQDPIQECRKILCQQRCLIVIDGLRSTHDWDLIKDAFLSEIHATESCIVVITNEKNAAKHVVRHVAGSEALNVKCLRADAAHSLFTKVAPEHIDGLTRKGMARLSQRTMDKSGGLPKVIAALGNELWLATNAWHAHNILNSYTTLDSLRGLFSWMQSYFDACSDSLKPCIFYLSVFPIGQDIRRRRLVTRWIAEGYSRDRFGSTAEDWNSSRDRSGSTADENGEKFFSDLIELSIIEQFTTSNVCQVNAFFHSYIISRPLEDNLVFALEGFCNLNSQRTGQHLTIKSTWDRDINVFESIDFTRLRSLTVFGKWESFLISDKMKRLRVLDLEDTSGVTDEDLKQIVKLLTRLKFLSLRGCKGIRRLPDSLDGMRQLQTLDVRHTFIVKLPPGICKLVKLQYIRAGNAEPWYEGDSMKLQYIRAGNAEPWYEGDSMVTIQPAVDEDQITMPPQDGGTVLQCWCHTEADNGGVKVPTGIGNLTALHTLGVINVNGAGGKALLEELKDGKLTQLRRLKVSGVNRGNIRHFFSAISGHRHLESLSVRLDEDVQDDISLRPQLRTLKLYGNVLNPNWTKFHSLKCLDIEMTITKGEDLQPLEQFVEKRILRRLCVKLIQDDDDLHLDMPNHQSSNFQNLKIDCSSKVQVTFGVSKLVKVLKVRCSSGSDLRFSGLKNLNSLEEVWLMGYCGDTLKQELQQQLSNHPKKKKPVLKQVRPCDHGRTDDGY